MDIVLHPYAVARRADELAADLQLAEDAFKGYRLYADRLGADLGRLLEAADAVAALAHLTPPHTHHLAGAYTADCLACAIQRLIRTARGLRMLRQAGRWPRPIVLTARHDGAPDAGAGATTHPAPASPATE